MGMYRGARAAAAWGKALFNVLFTFWQEDKLSFLLISFYSFFEYDEASSHPPVILNNAL